VHRSEIFPPMSVQGQSRSFGDVASMSGLPSRAAVRWTFRNGSFVPTTAVSGCNNGCTRRPATRSPRRRGEQRMRHVEGERLGGPEIDHQLKFDWKLHGKFARLRAPEDAST
jgi:hypothetical protein